MVKEGFSRVVTFDHMTWTMARHQPWEGVGWGEEGQKAFQEEETAFPKALRQVPMWSV